VRAGGPLCLESRRGPRGFGRHHRLLGESPLALLQRDLSLAGGAVTFLAGAIALAGAPITFLASGVPLAGSALPRLEGDVAVTAHALQLLQGDVAVTGHPIAFAGDGVPLLRSAGSKGSGGLPLARGVMRQRPCGVALGQHPVAVSQRGVPLRVRLIAFTDRLSALLARRVTLPRDLRRQACRRSLALGLGAQLGDTQADLCLDHLVSLGDGGVACGERPAQLVAQPLALALRGAQLGERLVA
jgi:hypothetical protein